MNQLLTTRLLISAHLLIVILVVSAGAWFMHRSQQDMRNAITHNIKTQLVTLEETAVLTDRNGADEVVSTIITDCAKRTQFERLLGDLASLNHKELLTTQQLFESCGSFHAERKAIMVSRLTREYEVLQQNVELLAITDPEHEYTHTAQTWKQIVTLETERSELLSEQVDIQRNIISQLLQGANVLSQDISDLASRARNIAEQLTVLDSRIDTLRGEATS